VFGGDRGRRPSSQQARLALGHAARLQLLIDGARDDALEYST
jgi:hypothetical protein